MKSKMLITGGNGLLGSDLAEYFKDKYTVFKTGRKDFDIRDFAAVEAWFKKNRPTLVLNAAAIADVDYCQDNEHEAMMVNAMGTENIGVACRRFGARLIHYSTDYVFDGQKNKPYVESDEPSPVNIYGKSKLEAEYRLQMIGGAFTILRVAWIYGAGEKSFVSRLITDGRKQIENRRQKKEATPLRLVSDQIGCPTWSIEIARQTDEIIEADIYGPVHAVSGGEVSRFDFAAMLFRALSLDVSLARCRLEDLSRHAPRPLYTPLENEKLNNLNRNVMQHHKEALIEFLEKKGRHE